MTEKAMPTLMITYTKSDSYQFNTRKMIEYSQKVGGRELTPDEKEQFRIWPAPCDVRFDEKTQRLVLA